MSDTPTILTGGLLDLKAYQTMRLWTDAYTARLEAVAEAQNDTRMRSRMEDNLKSLNAGRLMATSEAEQENLSKAKDNQAAILRRAQGFDLEAHREIQSIWRKVSRELLATGWALEQDLEVEVTEDKPPKLKMWQGKDKPKLWAGKEAALVMAFLRFVEETSSQAVDPRQVVMEQLARQGITKDNFHLHKDKLLVDNPWAPGP